MIVAVTGGKGGVGKSTVSLNLVRELEGVVVDADLTAPDLPRGRGRKPDLHAVLAGRAPPLEGIERVGSVRVLPCGRTLAGARAAELTRLPAVLDRLEREYHRVVVDCPAGLARDVGTVLHAADVAVLVTTPDESAVVDALRTREVAQTLGTPVAAGVLNKVEPTESETENPSSRLERRLAAPTTVIAASSVIAEARHRERPVRDVDPDSPIVDAFEMVGRTLERCERRRSETRCTP